MITLIQFKSILLSLSYWNYLCFFISLWLCLVIYNLYFSPCAHIPGPLASQLNPFTDLYYMIRGDFHVYVTDLHHLYGPVIRLGFDRICINDPEAWKQIHNNYKFSKTSFYDHMRTVGWSMISIKDRNQHAGRRRTVAKAFSESNILNLEATVIQSGISKLVNKLKKSNGKIVDMSKEFLYLAYDVIGKLVFSKDFNLLDGYNHDILIWIRSLLIFVVLNAVLPPVRLIGNPYYRKLAYMAKDAILQRRQMIENGEEAPTDLLNSLVHAKDPVTDEHIPMLDLMEECAELLLGGSDTTGNSLTWCLYLILKNSEARIKMENEIAAQFPDKTKTIKYKEIQKNLPYFQLVLKECMRYYPVASHPMLRSVPKEGVTIKDIYIPGNYEVITNCYAIHHNENYWKDPEKFDPERFNNPKENDLSAYLPFSSGPRGCVGRNLANLEMMLTLVNLFHKFNITLVNKEDLTPACHIVLHPKGHQPFWVSFTEK